MQRDKLSATTDVVTLAEYADGFGADVACRLEDHGFETIADILIADEGALTDVPYVSDLRADTLREAAGDVVDEHDDPLESDPVANALDVDLGEKVELVTEDGKSWAKPWCVVGVDDAVSWTAPLDEDFETRTVTIRTSPQSGRKYDLHVTGDEVWMAGEYKGREYRRLWRVAQVNPVGRISQSSYYQLVGQHQGEQNARPEGDDTWRKYQRGEA